MLSAMSDPSDSDLPEVSVLFATETCNAEDLSELAEKRLTEEGFPVARASVSDVEVEDLKVKPVILMIASTWGDGEPPSEAWEFHDELVSKDPMGLTDTRFSVLSLGDETYEHFCQCGKDFDAHLERHGAQRLYPRVDCDIDYDGPYEGWIDGVVDALKRPIFA